MLIIIFFTIVIATKFLIITEENIQSTTKILEQFDSNTFTTIPLLNMTMGLLGQCKFDKLNNIYFETTSLGNEVQFLLIKLNMSTKMSTFPLLRRRMPSEQRESC